MEAPKSSTVELWMRVLVLCLAMSLGAFNLDRGGGTGGGSSPNFSQVGGISLSDSDEVRGSDSDDSSCLGGLGGGGAWRSNRFSVVKSTESLLLRLALSELSWEAVWRDCGGVRLNMVAVGTSPPNLLTICCCLLKLSASFIFPSLCRW